MGIEMWQVATGNFKLSEFKEIESKIESKVSLEFPVTWLDVVGCFRSQVDWTLAVLVEDVFALLAGLAVGQAVRCKHASFGQQRQNQRLSEEQLSYQSIATIPFSATA